MQSMVSPLFHCVSMGYIWVTVNSHAWSMVSSMIEVRVCVAGGGSAVLSLLFVYPEGQTPVIGA